MNKESIEEAIKEPKRGVATLQYCPRCGFDTWHVVSSTGEKCMNCTKREKKDG